jgi:hypothetical protein
MELDRAVSDVKAKAGEFARRPARAKADLLRSVQSRLLETAPGWVRDACRAKGISPDHPAAGEEWLSGPFVAVRNARLLIESLEAIAQTGMPPLGRSVRVREDGRVELEVFPVSAIDRALFAGFTAKVLMQPGWRAADARERQAPFYQRRNPEGHVTVVLGAGNVAGIPPTDVFHRMFVLGHVCVLKMHPVNEWLGPFLERALAPLIEPGYLRIVYGGPEAGEYLVGHPDTEEIHITGTDRTHDLIVWGPPGPERTRRQAMNDPVFKKKITSELGNVSPVAIVPARYDERDLWFQARNVASMMVHNGAFNCNAARVVLTGRGWAQREEWVGMIRKALAEAPLRKAYYPGAHQRYRELLAGRDRVERFGCPAAEELPWAFLADLDPSAPGEKIFVEENFCGILAETGIGSPDPIEFLKATTSFCNNRLWGTLNAMIIVHPRLEKDPAVARALDRAVLDLRYGTVAINHWPAVAYAVITAPWGGHPSSTLADIQSGLGWVHNTYMLEGVEKSVLRGPCTVWPKPAWFYDNRQANRIGEKLVSLEAAPGWSKVPGLAMSAMRG